MFNHTVCSRENRLETLPIVVIVTSAYLRGLQNRLRGAAEAALVGSTPIHSRLIRTKERAKFPL